VSDDRRDIPAPTSQRIVAWVIVLVVIGTGTAVIAFGEGPWWMSLVAVLVVGLPMMVMADQITSHVSITDEGISRRTLLTGRTSATWEAISSVRLTQDWSPFGSRQVRVRFGKGLIGGKIVYRDSRAGFRDGTRKLVELARRHEVEVATPVLSNYDDWYEYLGLEPPPG
jgi:hypothetical protein